MQEDVDAPYAVAPECSRSSVKCRSAVGAATDLTPSRTRSGTAPHLASSARVTYGEAGRGRIARSPARAASWCSRTMRVRRSVTRLIDTSKPGAMCTTRPAWSFPGRTSASRVGRGFRRRRKISAGAPEARCPGGGRAHARGVEHQRVAGRDQRGQVREAPVGERSRRPIDHQQAALVAPRVRLLGDTVLRQVVLVVGGPEAGWRHASWIERSRGSGCSRPRQSNSVSCGSRTGAVYPKCR